MAATREAHDATEDGEHMVGRAGVVVSEQLVVLDGPVRVQALSPTLLRIEPRGPRGF